MPELPEVETIVRQLQPGLAGCRIVSVEILDPRLETPAKNKLPGRKILDITRLGKQVCLELSGNDRDTRGTFARGWFSTREACCSMICAVSAAFWCLIPCRRPCLKESILYLADLPDGSSGNLSTVRNRKLSPGCCARIAWWGWAISTPRKYCSPLE